MAPLKAKRNVFLIEVIVLAAIILVLVSTIAPLFVIQVASERVESALERASDARRIIDQVCDTESGSELYGTGNGRHSPPAFMDNGNTVDGRVVFVACKEGALTVVVMPGETDGDSTPVIEWRSKIPRDLEADGHVMVPRWDCRVLSGNPGEAPPECQEIAQLRP